MCVGRWGWSGLTNKEGHSPSLLSSSLEIFPFCSALSGSRPAFVRLRPKVREKAALALQVATPAATSPSSRFPRGGGAAAPAPGGREGAGRAAGSPRAEEGAGSGVVSSGLRRREEARERKEPRPPPQGD